MDDLEEICLVGLSATRDKLSSAIVLTWSKEGSERGFANEPEEETFGWDFPETEGKDGEGSGLFEWWGGFRVWKLQLKSDSGLIPAHLSSGSSRNGRKGPAYLDLKLVAPEEGHVYESILSYDPRSGVVSVVVTDVTAGERVYSGGFRINAYDGLLYPAVGGKAKVKEISQQHLLCIESLEAYSRFVPVGLQWSSGSSRGCGSPLLPMG